MIHLTTIFLGLGSNSEIEENVLGLTTRACATNFCNSKDSLSLWLSLEWFCYAPLEVLTADVRRMENSEVSVNFSPFHAGIICAFAGVIGFVIGLIIRMIQLNCINCKNVCDKLTGFLMFIIPRGFVGMKISSTTDDSRNNNKKHSHRIFQSSNQRSGYVRIPESEFTEG